MDPLLIVAAIVLGTIFYVGTIFFRRLYLHKPPKEDKESRIFLPNKGGGGGGGGGVGISTEISKEPYPKDGGAAYSADITVRPVLQHENARHYLKSKFGDKISDKDIEDIIFTLFISSGGTLSNSPNNKDDTTSFADISKNTYKINFKTPLFSLITHITTSKPLIEVGVFLICLAIAFLILSMAFHYL